MNALPAGRRSLLDDGKALDRACIEKAKARSRMIAEPPFCHPRPVSITRSAFFMTEVAFLM
jgi:hypothetical protein